MLGITSNKKIALLATGILLLLLGGALPTVSATPSDRRITAFTGPNGGWFGFSVAVSGNNVFVGAPYENAGFLCESLGRVYIFSATGSLISVISSPSGQCGGGFGTSIAVSRSLIVVGAPGEGRVYIFNNAGSLIATLTSPEPFSTPGNPTGFGYSVTVSGASVVVGAPDERAGGFQGAGHAYIFSSTGSLIATLTSPNPQPSIFGGVRFGYSVAVSGASVVVGAPGETEREFQAAGHAYIFSTAGSLIANLTSPHRQFAGEFGFSVAASGTNVVVGTQESLFEPHVFQGAGRAYVFNSIGSLIATLTSPNAQNYGSFGWSVAASGTNVVVGAIEETATGLGLAGRAYIFSITGSLIANLTSPSPQYFGLFGSSVAVSGTSVIVGAPGQTSNSVGHAYLFMFQKVHVDR